MGVLRSNTEILYDRLIQRKDYNTKKINENMECEIMQIVLDETRHAFGNNNNDGENKNGIVIVELMNNNINDMDSNIQRIELWIDQWRMDNQYSFSCRKKKTKT